MCRYVMMCGNVEFQHISNNLDPLCHVNSAIACTSRASCLVNTVLSPHPFLLLLY